MSARRRHGRLLPLTTEDRVRKFIRNERRGRPQNIARKVHEPTVAKVQRGKTERSREPDLQGILERVLGDRVR